jgi:hypothetical protein
VSWSRFLVVFAATAGVCVLVYLLIGQTVIQLEEPLRTGLITIGAVVIFSAIDWLIGQVLARRERGVEHPD